MAIEGHQEFAVEDFEADDIESFATGYETTG